MNSGPAINNNKNIMRKIALCTNSGKQKCRH